MTRWIFLLLIVLTGGCQDAPSAPEAAIAETPSTPAKPNEPATNASDNNSPQAGEALVTLTPRAAIRIRELIASDGRKDKLRVSLVEKLGGGVHWSVSLTGAVDPFDDITVESQGITIVLDRASRETMGATTVDFVQRNSKGEFTFESNQLRKAP